MMLLQILGHQCMGRGGDDTLNLQVLFQGRCGSVIDHNDASGEANRRSADTVHLAIGERLKREVSPLGGLHLH